MLTKTSVSRVASMVVLLVALLAAAPSCAPSAMTPEQRLADFEYLYSGIAEGYPFLGVWERVFGYRWEERYEEFRLAAATARDDHEWAVAISSMLGSLACPHTTIIPGNYVEMLRSSLAPAWLRELVADTTAQRAQYWYGLAASSAKSSSPVAVAYASGRYVVVAAAHGPVRWGWHLSAIGDVPVDEYVRAEAGRLSLRWDPIERKPYSPNFALPVGRATFDDTDGGTVDLELPEAPPGWRHALERWPALMTNDSVYSATLSGDVGYLRLRDMGWYDGLIDELARHLKPMEYTQDLIIDVRGNLGGSTSTWLALVGMITEREVSQECLMFGRSTGFISDYLHACTQGGWGSEVSIAQARESLPSNSLEATPPEIWTEEFGCVVSMLYAVQPRPEGIGYKGPVWVLTDDRTYSAADGFAAFCRATGWATLVGGPTGGDGIGFNPYYMVLPHSRMAVAMSSVLGLNPDGTVNAEVGTLPDILVREAGTEIVGYRSARPAEVGDVVLRECLRQIELRRAATGR